MPPASARRLLAFVIGALFTAGAIALVRDTASQGQDFEVFWSTARHVIAGESPYNLARDGAMAFKYPPWAVPVFFPFALFPLAMAKWLWGFVELGSLAYCLRWLRRSKAGRGAVVACAIAFWGIWAVHALDGQITLALLALSLWSARRLERRPSNPVFLAVVTWAMSLKALTAVSLAGVARGYRRLSSCVAVVAFLGALSLPALMSTAEHDPIGLMRSWSAAASSGGLLFGSEKIRGRENQGLPALALRMAGVRAAETRADVWVSLAIALAGAILWAGLSAGLDFDARLAGWLALGAIAHPLAWFHLFVLAFPLAVLSVGRARGRGELALACVGVFMIAVFTGRIFGTLGDWAEFFSVKSLGVLVCASVLARSGAHDRLVTR